jgi:oxalate decarboxylase/phosphoglucose isomerase-like protein (cupin superfamily)
MATIIEQQVADVADYLSLCHCTVLRGRGQEWATPNSVVASIPALTLEILSSACLPKNLTASIVKVAGPTHEPMHFHTSYIVGLVVAGSGSLLSQDASGQEARERVISGDVVIIPRGALHVFVTEAEEAMDYIALEFSDGELDYQAHWTDSQA